MKIKRALTTGALLGLILSLAGCSAASGLGSNKKGPRTGGINGFNHTLNEIARFSINGSGGSIGGTVCCIMLPNQWSPNLKANIKWKSLDVSKLSPMPKFNQVEAYNRWEAELEKYSTYHEISVPIPQYGEKTCGIDVHFLPCNQVKVTTSCKSYFDPEYPINEPMNMKEPSVCPK